MGLDYLERIWYSLFLFELLLFEFWIFIDD